jgi:S1-C subfamily serine protease
MSSYPHYEYDPRPRRRGGMAALILLLLLIVVSAAIGLTVGRQLFSDALERPAAVPRPIEARGDLAADEKATIELFRQSSPSVVNITNVALQQDIFSFNITEIPQGTGTGFLWDDKGHVVTNWHVLHNANAARVTLADHSVWEATLVGVAADKDLAVVRITAPRGKLRPLPIGQSANLVVGQKVFAIGNPFGLDQTLTTGIISALGREIPSSADRVLRDVIQTDAAINPGNSGGPLLDSAARLIGVNTAIFSPSGASAGIGFAIPVDTVNRVVPDLIRHGKLQRAGLGVDAVADNIARRIGVQGVIIRGMPADSAAARAGLRPTRRDASGNIALGDVVVGVDGKTVRSQADLVAILDEYKIGDVVTLTVLRDGAESKVKLTLQALD